MRGKGKMKMEERNENKTKVLKKRGEKLDKKYSNRLYRVLNYPLEPDPNMGLMSRFDLSTPTRKS